jgi:hypothetical protein
MTGDMASTDALLICMTPRQMVPKKALEEVIEGTTLAASWRNCDFAASPRTSRRT